MTVFGLKHLLLLLKLIVCMSSYFITSSNSLVLPSLPSSLIHRRRFHLAVQSFKILHGFCPSYLSNLLCYSNVITGRTSRNPYRAFLLAVRTNYGRDAISFQDVYLWNNLNSSLYQCKDLKELKNLYKLLYNFQL